MGSGVFRIFDLLSMSLEHMFTTNSDREAYFGAFRENTETIGIYTYRASVVSAITECEEVSKVLLVGSASTKCVETIRSIVNEAATQKVSPQLFVMDISPEAVSNSSNYQGGRDGVSTTFIQGDLLKMPVSSNSIDFIHLDFVEPFITMDHQRELFRQVARILKKGGVASSFVNTISSRDGEAPRGSWEYSDKEKTHYRKYNNRGVNELDFQIEYLTALAEDAGLEARVTILDHTSVYEEEFVGFGSGDMGYSDNDINALIQQGKYDLYRGVKRELTGVDRTQLIMRKL